MEKDYSLTNYFRRQAESAFLAREIRIENVHEGLRMEPPSLSSRQNAG